MIRTYTWDPEAKTCRLVDSGELPATSKDLPAGQTVWIDLVEPTPEEVDRVFDRYLPVHPLTKEDITRPDRLPGDRVHLPKVEEFADYLFAIVNPLPAKGSSESHHDGADRPQLSVVLTHHLLITHHTKPLDCVQRVWDYVRRHDGCVGRGPDYLFHLILDAMVDEYAPVVETLADQLDEIEDTLFRMPSQEQLVRLLALKRQVSYLRKTLILEREVLARLTRGEFALVESREIAYYRNVYDHLVRYTELVESGREMVSDLLQTHLSAVSFRLNEVMKLLTMFTAILMPMTLVAGIYGMNFDVLPETKWTYGYPFALGVMALIGLTGLGYFRWKRWL